MEQIISGMGVAGIGFAFLYFVLSKNFESQTKLIEKIDKLADNIHELIVRDTQKNANLHSAAEDLKDNYNKISNKQESIKKTVEEINIRTQLCPKQLRKEDIE